MTRLLTQVCCRTMAFCKSGEQAPWNRDLGHLEGNIATVADELGADLDQLLLQARQRPVPDRLRCRQGTQEVAEIVGQRVKLEPDSVSNSSGRGNGCWQSGGRYR